MQYEPPWKLPGFAQGQGGGKVLAVEPLVASWRMVRAALVGIR